MKIFIYMLISMMLAAIVKISVAHVVVKETTHFLFLMMQVKNRDE